MTRRFLTLLLHSVVSGLRYYLLWYRDCYFFWCFIWFCDGCVRSFWRFAAVGGIIFNGLIVQCIRENELLLERLILNSLQLPEHLLVRHVFHDRRRCERALSFYFDATHIISYFVIIFLNFFSIQILLCNFRLLILLDIGFFVNVAQSLLYQNFVVWIQQLIDELCA